MDQFDYVVIGAGSAGCVLAHRLSENPQHRVLLLEYGGSDRSIIIQMPSAFSLPMNTRRFNWHYQTEPERALQGRRLHCPRGKVLGGSSSINGLVYMRGHAYDFDEWQSLGARGWSYAHCLPYFRRAEHWYAGGDAYRGASGPLHTNAGNEMRNPLYGAWVQAGEQAGYNRTNDCNGYLQEGFGAMHMTVQNGYRCSTARAYLYPIAQRPNLKIVTHAMVNKIGLTEGCAKTVSYIQDTTHVTVGVTREVIVSAGPIGSPHILQRSGIGPAAVLQQAGVAVQHHLPGVGANLQDHSEIYIQWQCKQAVSLNGHMNMLGKIGIGLRWLLQKKGLGVSNHFEAGGFIRSRTGLRWPDIQFHFLPAAMRYDGHKPLKGHGFMVLTGPNKPKSRGTVHIQSPDPFVHPQIRFNYLSHEADRQGFRACVRLTREIVAQPAMDPFRGAELAPGKDVQTDDEIDDFVSANMESTMHPCGTCRMGEDALSVVDSELRVHGLRGLRVIDSSIFPTEPNGNLNAPTIMVAERGSDLILGKDLLPQIDLPVGLAEHWQTRQRPGTAQRAYAP